MFTLYVFFISVILLEVLALVGIFLACRKLHQAKLDLQMARVNLTRFRLEMSRSFRQGQQTAEIASRIGNLVYSFLPGWVRASVSIVSWLGKINPRTS